MESPCTILIVDDDPRGREVLHSLLTPEGHILETAASGMEALEKAARLHPDVILLDVMMPEMDGYDVCKALRADAKLAEVPVILVTALDDRDSLLQGLEAGADEFVAKPFNRIEMRTRIRSLTRLNRYKRLMAERKLLEQTLEGTIGILSDLLAMSDPQSFGLSQAMRTRARQLANTLGVQDPWPIELAALLCQIGCVTVPAPVLARARESDQLPQAEKALLERIPEIGRTLLSHIPQLKDVANMVYFQNKHFNGAGFPECATKCEEIPLGARILKVAADLARFQAKGLGASQSLREMATRIGWYDPRVLAAATKLCAAEEDAANNQRTIVREVKFAQLQPGWRLRQDLLTRDGTLLLSAGNTISPAVYERIRNFVAISGIREPFLVEQPEPTPTPAAA